MRTGEHLSADSGVGDADALCRIHICATVHAHKFLFGATERRADGFDGISRADDVFPACGGRHNEQRARGRKCGQTVFRDQSGGRTAERRADRSERIPLSDDVQAERIVFLTQLIHDRTLPNIVLYARRG